MTPGYITQDKTLSEDQKNMLRAMRAEMMAMTQPVAYEVQQIRQMLQAEQQSKKNAKRHLIALVKAWFDFGDKPE